MTQGAITRNGGAEGAGLPLALILSAAFGREKSAALWLLSGFGGAIVVLVAATSAFQLATGVVLTGMGFFYLVLAVNIGALAMARVPAGQWPAHARRAGRAGRHWY